MSSRIFSETVEINLLCAKCAEQFDLKMRQTKSVTWVDINTMQPTRRNSWMPYMCKEIGWVRDSTKRFFPFFLIQQNYSRRFFKMRGVPSENLRVIGRYAIESSELDDSSLAVPSGVMNQMTEACLCRIIRSGGWIAASPSTYSLYRSQGHERLKTSRPGLLSQTMHNLQKLCPISTQSRKTTRSSLENVKNSTPLSLNKQKKF